MTQVRQPRSLRNLLGRPAALALAAVAAMTTLVWQLTRADLLGADEAARVAIAQRRPGELADQVREAGLRPLWFASQHVWIELFGAGDRSVHIATVALVLATLPAAYLAGRALRDHELGLLAVVVFALSPQLFAAGLDVGPDVLLVLLATLGVWSAARLVRTGAVLDAVLLAAI